MIFATVGSHPSFRFDRFLRALETLPGDDLVVQHGPGEPPRNARRAAMWMSFDEMLDQMNRAEKVVSHAGTGTVLMATRAGHTPVVVPRLHRFDETVDDHQLDLARALAETGRIIVVEDLDELATALARAPVRGTAQASVDDGLVQAVRRELLDSSA